MPDRLTNSGLDTHVLLCHSVTPSQYTVITPFYATHHFTVTLQAISGLSPTTSVISTLPYYEYTLTGYLSVTHRHIAGMFCMELTLGITAQDQSQVEYNLSFFIQEFCVLMMPCFRIVARVTCCQLAL